MTLKYLPGVTTLSYDVQKCRGCGRCAEVCPHGVFVLENGRARVVDRNACIECGACQKNCPFEAVKVKAGVGCAAAYIQSFGTGKPPCCGGDGGSGCCG